MSLQCDWCGCEMPSQGRFLSLPSGPREKEVSGEPNGVEREVTLTSHQCAPPVKSRCLEAALTP